MWRSIGAPAWWLLGGLVVLRLLFWRSADLLGRLTRLMRRG
jgi:hypothetical protein